MEEAKDWTTWVPRAKRAWRKFWTERRLTVAQAVLLWPGLALLLAASIAWVPAYLHARSEQRAPGVVEQVETRQNAAGELTYFAHLMFRLPDGTVQHFVVPAGQAADAFTPGEHFPVLYRADAPAATARIGTNQQVYRTSIGLGITGVVLFDFGYVCWFVLRRREMAREQMRRQRSS